MSKLLGHTLAVTWRINPHSVPYLMVDRNGVKVVIFFHPLLGSLDILFGNAVCNLDVLNHLRSMLGNRGGDIWGRQHRDMHRKSWLATVEKEKWRFSRFRW